MYCDDSPFWLGDRISVCYQDLIQEAVLGAAGSASVVYLAWWYRFRRPLDGPQLKHRSWRKIVELLLCVAQLTLILTEPFIEVVDIELAYWTYASSLVLSRLLWPFNEVWRHSAALYLVGTVVGLVDVWNYGTSWDTASFVIVAALFVLTWSDPIGDYHPVVNESSDSGLVPPPPEETASLFSLATWSFVDSLLWEGYWTSITMDRIPAIWHGLRTSVLLKTFDNTRGGLIRRLLVFNRNGLIISTILAFFNAIASYGPALIVKLLLEYVEDPASKSPRLLWSAIAGLFLLELTSGAIVGQCFYVSKRMKISAQNVIMCEVYKKALRRRINSDPKAKKKGAIVNLMSVDAEKVAALYDQWHYFINGLCEIGVASYLLYHLLGTPALYGIAAALAWSPVDYLQVLWHSRLEEKLMSASDDRIEKTNELLQCIRVVKLFAWEGKFIESVQKAREIELGFHVKQLIVDTLGTASWLATPIIESATALAVFTLVDGKELTSAVGYTAITMFHKLRNPLESMVITVGDLADARVSMIRLAEFLAEPETTNESIDNDTLKLENASFRWNSREDSFQLRDLSVEFPLGKLSVVAGTTGSGKSSLLMALLGEMELSNGSFYGPHFISIAYCAQQPWLINDTLRNNIVFGSDYDADWYFDVVEACALNEDVESLQNGHDTLVGEKGVILSGGQKQRISLARAMYASSEFIFLDDCLSAVDVDTAKHIYDNCLTNRKIIDGRTVILVSHNVKLAASKADKLVQMSKGRIIYDGMPEFAAIEAIEEQEASEELDKHHQGTDNQQDTENNEDDEEQDESDDDEDDENDDDSNEETKATGRVSFKVYRYYFSKYGGFWYWLGVPIVFALALGSDIAVTAWIRTWTQGDNTNAYYFKFYVLLGVVNIFLGGAPDVYMYTGGIRASSKVFKNMLTSVVSSQMRFFDTTPLGRITNRFAKDINDIDNELPSSMNLMLFMIADIISTVGVVVYVTPQVSIVVLVLFVIYYGIAGIYLESSREMKRYKSISESPIFQHFGETVSGAVTIRAYNHGQRFTEVVLQKLDTYTRPFWYLWTTNRWLNFRFQVVSSLISVGTATFVVVFNDRIDAGLAGLSLTYALGFNNAILWFLKFYADLETEMNSAERTQEYSQLPSEKYDTFRPNLEPSKGNIAFENVCVRYAPDLPRVVDNLSFSVKSGEKLAIIGRTGAGKSTIISALFRIVDIESGAVKIDGVDTKSTNLQSLRRSLAVITQDPVLFAGTVRSNLDPFEDQYDDIALHEALNRVQLGGVLSLDMAVSEGGHNLSQGQRQLLCLARAILKKPKILALDEATASIDRETDSKIQETIRTQFEGTTLITIAHRLETVTEGYDHMLMMENGTVKHFGPPLEVIAKYKQQVQA